jgi:hypothetical protein
VPREYEYWKAYVPLPSWKAHIYRSQVQSVHAFFKKVAPKFAEASSEASAISGVEQEKMLYLLADTAWEAIPFSWLVDYFWDVQGLIRKVTLKDQLLYHEMEISRFRFTGYEYLLSAYAAPTDSPDVYDISTGGAYDAGYSSYHRPTHLGSLSSMRIGFQAYQRLVDIPDPSLELLPRLASIGGTQYGNILAVLWKSLTSNKRI